MRLFDLIKRKLFNEPPPLVDCVRDKEWYERKYGKEVSKYMKWEEDGQKKSEGTLKDGELDGLWTYWDKDGSQYEGKVIRKDDEDGTFLYWYDNEKKKIKYHIVLKQCEFLLSGLRATNSNVYVSLKY